MYTQVGKPHLHWLESGSPNVPKIWDGVVPAAITHSCILEVVVERSTPALKSLATGSDDYRRGASGRVWLVYLRHAVLRIALSNNKS
ncbi:MAG: hypothetical protein V7K27_09035 [Nostoc sp.]|uniref:hypothetical protein n=1 Tax=Nostoc sp. TaxID=1180 RepID=UPI002FF81CD2